MVDGIGMALTSLKAASDLGKSLLELRDTAKISATTVELLGKVAAATQLTLAAQAEQAALRTEVEDLKRQIVGFENWNSEKERYELKQLVRGFVAYVVKPSMRRGEPAHAICPNCYERRIKSILQSNGKTVVYDHAWNCPSCKTSFMCQGRDMDSMYEKAFA